MAVRIFPFTTQQVLVATSAALTAAVTSLADGNGVNGSEGCLIAIAFIAGLTNSSQFTTKTIQAGNVTVTKTTDDSPHSKSDE